MTSKENETEKKGPETPRELDVLCGSGMERFHRIANEIFCNEVLKFVDFYSLAETKKDKMQVSKAAYDAVTAAGVRFLKKNPIDQCWYVASPKVGRDKIGHFLRRQRVHFWNIHSNIRADSSSPQPESNTRSSLFRERKDALAANREPRALSIKTNMCDRAERDNQSLFVATFSALHGEIPQDNSMRLEFPEWCADAKAIISNSPIAHLEESQMSFPTSQWLDLETTLKLQKEERFDAKKALNAVSNFPCMAHPEGVGVSTSTLSCPSQSERSIRISNVQPISSSTPDKKSGGEGIADYNNVELFDDSTLAEWLD